MVSAFAAFALASAPDQDWGRWDCQAVLLQLSTQEKPITMVL